MAAHSGRLSPRGTSAGTFLQNGIPFSRNLQGEGRLLLTMQCFPARRISWPSLGERYTVLQRLAGRWAPAAHTSEAHLLADSWRTVYRLQEFAGRRAPAAHNEFILSSRRPSPCKFSQIGTPFSRNLQGAAPIAKPIHSEQQTPIPLQVPREGYTVLQEFARKCASLRNQFILSSRRPSPCKFLENGIPFCRNLQRDAPHFQTNPF